MQGGSINQFSEEIARLLKLNDEEEDDATSSLKEHEAPKPEGFAQSLCPPEHLEWTAGPFSQSPFNVNFSSGFEVRLIVIMIVSALRLCPNCLL